MGWVGQRTAVSGEAWGLGASSSVWVPAFLLFALCTLPVLLCPTRSRPLARLLDLAIRGQPMEKTLESPLDSKEIKPVHPKGKTTLNIHWKDWCWSCNTLATWWEEPVHWKRPWCWEPLRAGGEGDGRGWDGWMASLTLWTWVWASSRR